MLVRVYVCMSVGVYDCFCMYVALNVCGVVCLYVSMFVCMCACLCSVCICVLV